MKTIYLHIGTHKTGTTTIQSILSANQEAILAQGYYYSKKCRIRITPGNHPLAWALLHGDRMLNEQTGEILDLSCAWSDFLEEIPQAAENIIISSEYFCLFRDEQVLTLKEILANFRVIPILYLRRQDKFLLSLYSENVKSNGHFESVHSFIQNQQEKVDYLGIIDRWSRAFGHENMVIGLYTLGEGNTDLIGDFLSKIGIVMDRDELKIGDRRFNVNPPIKLLKIIRFLNWLMHGKFSMSLAQCRQLYTRNLLSRHIVNAASLIPDKILSDHWLSVPEREDLISSFEAMNAKIATEYLGKPDGKLF